MTTPSSSIPAAVAADSPLVPSLITRPDLAIRSARRLGDDDPDLRARGQRETTTWAGLEAAPSE